MWDGGRWTVDAPQRGPEGEGGRPDSFLPGGGFLLRMATAGGATCRCSIGELRVRSTIIAVVLFVLLAGGMAGGWMAMSYFQPGTVGTPARAGALSNGRPETCTNLQFPVRPRSEVEKVLAVQPGDLVRGTFEADGGLGRVDVLMRLVSPQGEVLLLSPRASNYDFSFPAKVRGEYTVVFDNRFSLYTSKSVALYYCIDRGGPVVPVVPFTPAGAR